MYILWEEKDKYTISSSLQACFVVAHSSGECSDELVVYLSFSSHNIVIYIYIYGKIETQTSYTYILNK